MLERIIGHRAQRQTAFNGGEILKWLFWNNLNRFITWNRSNLAVIHKICTVCALWPLDPCVSMCWCVPVCARFSVSACEFENEKRKMRSQFNEPKTFDYIYSWLVFPHSQYTIMPVAAIRSQGIQNVCLGSPLFFFSLETTADATERTQTWQMVHKCRREAKWHGTVVSVVGDIALAPDRAQLSHGKC